MELGSPLAVTKSSQRSPGTGEPRILLEITVLYIAYYVRIIKPLSQPRIAAYIIMCNWESLCSLPLPYITLSSGRNQRPRPPAQWSAQILKLKTRPHISRVTLGLVCPGGFWYSSGSSYCSGIIFKNAKNVPGWRVISMSPLFLLQRESLVWTLLRGRTQLSIHSKW